MINDKCPFCNSSELQLYTDGSGFCLKCKKTFSSTKIDKLIIKRESDELKRYKDVEKKKTETINEPSQNSNNNKNNIQKEPLKIGYYLMLVGAIIYFITSIFSMNYTPNYDTSSDLQSIINITQSYADTVRIIGVVGFLAILTFMVGSILQIKSLLDN